MDIIIMSIVSICLPRCYFCVYSLSSAANEGKVLAMTTGFSINLIRICIHCSGQRIVIHPCISSTGGLFSVFFLCYFFLLTKLWILCPRWLIPLPLRHCCCTDNCTEYSIIVLSYLTEILEGKKPAENTSVLYMFPVCIGATLVFCSKRQLCITFCTSTQSPIILKSLTSTNISIWIRW